MSREYGEWGRVSNFNAFSFSWASCDTCGLALSCNKIGVSIWTNREHIIDTFLSISSMKYFLQLLFHHLGAIHSKLILAETTKLSSLLFFWYKLSFIKYLGEESYSAYWAWLLWLSYIIHFSSRLIFSVQPRVILIIMHRSKCIHWVDLIVLVLLFLDLIILISSVIYKNVSSTILFIFKTNTFTTKFYFYYESIMNSTALPSQSRIDYLTKRSKKIRIYIFKMVPYNTWKFLNKINKLFIDKAKQACKNDMQ